MNPEWKLETEALERGLQIALTIVRSSKTIERADERIARVLADVLGVLNNSTVYAVRESIGKTDLELQERW